MSETGDSSNNYEMEEEFLEIKLKPSNSNSTAHSTEERAWITEAELVSQAVKALLKRKEMEKLSK